MIRAPAELSHLASLLGDEALLRLIETAGGQKLEMPVKRPRGPRGMEIEQRIGRVAFDALRREYGGTRLQVPLAKRWRARVYRERDGASFNEIARRLQVSEQCVARWLRETPVESAQMAFNLA